MHQIGFVENIAIELAALGLLNNDLRSLRNARQQFVRRVCGEHHGFGTARTPGTNRMHILIKTMECGVRQPSLIEMERIHQIAQLGFDRLDVVDHTIVRTLGQSQNARTLVFDIPGKGIGIDFFLDVFRLEFLEGNRSDDAHVIACRAQKHGDRTRHRDRVQDRLVTVAVHHHDIVGGHVGMPDNLVRCRCSIGHKITMIGIENPRCV